MGEFKLNLNKERYCSMSNLAKLWKFLTKDKHRIICVASSFILVGGVYYFFRKAQSRSSSSPSLRNNPLVQQVLEPRKKLDEIYTKKKSEINLVKTPDEQAYTKETIFQLEELNFLGNRERFFKIVDYYRQLRRKNLTADFEAYKSDCLVFFPELYNLMDIGKVEFMVEEVGVNEQLYTKGLQALVPEDLIVITLNNHELLVGNREGKILDEATFDKTLDFATEQLRTLLRGIITGEGEDLALQPLLRDDTLQKATQVEIEDLTETCRHYAYERNDGRFNTKLEDYLRVQHDINTQLLNK
eukprot:TRINITY_DN2169_c0_g1_i1.p1 TRINITY_DN2169_c0_g1~~TRINITY_DN2169_c0_g1_i1.p1  ORF type:complete len:300 (-),score=58.36 TRINITY_DN2169_c0_g1_i1:127-1026(-)